MLVFMVWCEKLTNLAQLVALQIHQVFLSKVSHDGERFVFIFIFYDRPSFSILLTSSPA
jgi:hypothetical protein